MQEMEEIRQYIDEILTKRGYYTPDEQKIEPGEVEKILLDISQKTRDIDERRKAKARKNYYDNIEKITKQAKKYRENNKDKIREKNQRYTEKHREEINRKRREKYAKQKEAKKNERI